MPNDSKSVICLSDSMTVYSMNPRFWPELVNLSSEAAPMDAQLMKLKDILELNHGRIKAVLLDVSMIRLSGESKRPALNAMKESAKFFPIYVWHGDGNSIWAKVCFWVKISPNWVRYKCTNLVKRKWNSELVQGYIRRDVSRIQSCMKSETEDAIGYASICNEFLRGRVNQHSWSLQCLRSMLEQCKMYGVEAWIVSLPLNRLVLERLEPESVTAFNNLLDALCDEYSIGRLNFLQENLDDGCFININHLNYEGGRIITTRIREGISSKR